MGSQESFPEESQAAEERRMKVAGQLLMRMWMVVPGEPVGRQFVSKALWIFSSYLVYIFAPVTPRFIRGCEIKDQNNNEAHSQ